MPSGLELYPHNEKAYRKLLDMLSGTRRACIIHPTGTGKAFIAYRYAFDHPNERILWMSPSTYIEQEQEASIRRELPNQEFKNIERMTYQTAMHRAQKGNLDIHADTVIFDEFHHTGAPQWSRGVEGVIECNPDANLIGLSATSIRYSDSGRDMSDELFDGHIASYMSLTDCWVLGILPVPTYVTAGYSINGYIEDLGERIAKEESAGRRAELLADFNELRDCASRAANLPAIFQKYFEGIEKVIVFCPNVFELNEIEKMCPRWFSRVNGNVHTYVVHSSNPFGTSEYDGFKEDDDETAIKLLLCVNQLNEGVHIKGVDAVIMVRRTSSPTIFYQQLGRALTAAGNFEPLVIDLVDNFEMIERAFQAMREDGAVSGTAVLTDIDPGCRAELNGFKPYLETRIEVFNGQNGQKNVLAEAGKALSSGSLSAICDDYGMDYAVLNYGINDVGIQDLEESGFKPVYSDNLTVCLKRSTV